MRLRKAPLDCKVTKSRRRYKTKLRKRKLNISTSTMLAAIDKYLAAYAPSWYRTPVSQTSALGLVFFWVFSAYTTIQFYAKSTYGSELAADCVSALYLTFTLACLVMPPIINKCGCRSAMLWGVLGYANLILASLIYFEYGGENVRWARRLVVLGGAILGVGASALWTAQGRLILQYAARAEELEKQVESNESGKAKGKAGILMSIFWSIFQCSSLIGGSISFIYYNKKPEGSTSLYCLFLGFTLIGAMFTQFLLPPYMLKMQQQHDFEMESEQSPLNIEFSEQYNEDMSEMSDKNEAVIQEDLSQMSFFEEAKATVQIFFTPKMMYLTPLFVYTGFNQPYQQATFGNRFFTRRTIGAELIIFHLMEILGAIIVGRFLDNEKSRHNSARKRALVCLWAFAIINGFGNAIAFFQEMCAKQNLSPITTDIAEVRAIIPSSAFALWGFADAQIQVYCYWLIGSFFDSGHDHARAVGWYKCVQSLGTSIGYYLIPAQRLSEIAQLTVSTFVFIVGTVLAFTRLPKSP